MYHIKSYTIREFIEDEQITLPRYQRKKTWDAIKNFKLCISVFKQYPIGVCIVSEMRSPRGDVKKFLLDGRQRREALTDISTDPENVYKWAMKFLKFNKNTNDSDLRDLFDQKVQAFLEKEELRNENTDEDSSEDSLSSSEELDLTTEELGLNDDAPEETDDNGQPYTESEFSDDGLRILCDLIVHTHHWNKKGSGFTAPFDFCKFVRNCPFADYHDDNAYTLSSRDLKSFIWAYKENCKRLFPYEKDAFRDGENFFNYIKKNCGIAQPNIESKLKEYVERHWNAMLIRMDLLQSLKDVLSNNEIGVIEVGLMEAYDYQKIFNLINTQGEDLKAVEVLSAKPKWNYRIRVPHPDLVSTATALYNYIGTRPDYYVNWDLAATFVNRLSDNFFFKHFDYAQKSGFEDQLTSGFVILSGIYVKRVDKQAFDVLGDKNINWDSDIDRLVADINNMINVLTSNNFFSFLKTWKCNLMDLMSSYIAYNFFLMTYHNWVKKGSPFASGPAVKQFQKDAFILLDRLIYEYLTGKWKGSGDSRTRTNINSLLDNANYVFEPISEENWTSLLSELFDNNKINGDDIRFDKMKPLLYHFYCLNGQRGPSLSENETFDVDHIIPQKLFTDSAIINRDIIKDNLLNLGVLPKRENCSKGKKRLIEMKTNAWMVSEIKEYEFIPEDKFEVFSDVSNYREMYALRRPIFEKAFKEKRNQILNNWY